MQDLIKYKGFSIFFYCLNAEDGKYSININITDVENRKDPETSIRLTREYTDIEEGLDYARRKGIELVDARIKGETLNPSEFDTDLKYRDMKGSIE